MKIDKKTVSVPEGEITLYTLTNAQGASVTLSSLGAGIVSAIVPDKDGKMADVVLGYGNPADYFGDGPCAGKTPGRFANRIEKGHLSLDGNTYQLAINNNGNHLHGGPAGFQNRIWKSDTEGNQVIFTYHSADGEENYPGNLDVRVTYTWSDDNTLTINYEAVTDKTTVVNLTNHAYFNLAGHDSGTVLDHILWLGCDKWLPTDSTLVPTGEIAQVNGTPMDFTSAKTIGRDIFADFAALKYGKGYDNCFVVTDWQNGIMAEVAVLTDPVSGRMLKVYTDQPGVQVYAGCWLAGCPAGKDGAVYKDYDGVAIECQGFPDAPNKPEFPSSVLRPGERYCRQIQFAFRN